jgi:hypothetical protein
MQRKHVDILMPTAGLGNHLLHISSINAIESINKMETSLHLTFYAIFTDGQTDIAYPSYVRKIVYNTNLVHSPITFASHINAEALEIGRIVSKSEYIFVAHNDVLAYRKDFMSYLMSKLDEGHDLAGLGKDNIRINAIHVSGFLFKRSNFSSCPFLPDRFPEIDVGDQFTESATNPFCTRNSINDRSLLPQIHEKYPEVKNIPGDKAIDEDGNLLYIHMGRGSTKTERLPTWISLGNSVLRG